MQWVFWICAFGAAYSYAIYPLALLLFVPKRVPVVGQLRTEVKEVSLIVACRNEERRLRPKLENALSVTYPNLEILVASDASDDASDAIVREHESRGVRLVRTAERRGKEFAQGAAIAQASGDVIVFSDSGTDLPPESISIIVERFSDPEVGALSSEDVFVRPDGKLVGEGLYVRYEMWLRRLESERAGLVGLSGSFFAIRRSIIKDWYSNVPSDFACALMSVRAGKVAVSDARVRGIYKDIKDASKEYQRKVRTAIRGMAGLAQLAEVLNPFRYGVFSFQVWSHKVMRWLVPWFLLGLLVANIALLDSRPLYALTFWLQVVGYLLLLCAHVVAPVRDIGVVRIAYYFMQANVALAHAGVLFVAGRRVVTWDPSVR